MIYLVSCIGAGNYDFTVVEGPEQADWVTYCNDLIPEAVEAAFNKHRNRPTRWPDVKEELIRLLRERDYKVRNLEEASYGDGELIAEDEDIVPSNLLKSVLEHNQRLAAEDFLRRKTK